MKLIQKIMIISMLLLAACNPVVEPEPAVDVTVTPAVEVTTTLEVEVTATSVLVTPISPLADPAEDDQSSLAWNSDPNVLFSSATFCCGFTPYTVQLNYIPAAQIWGDGRIVWTEISADNTQRRVLSGQLSPEQMQALVQQATDVGFFSGPERYADNSIADAAEQCLTINLEAQSKKVCEYFKGAPPEFHALYDFVASGAGASGSDYLPERGYVVAHPLDLPEGFTPPITAVWPTQSLGFPLSSAIDGMWVEGDALQESWAIVNTNWQGAIIEDDGIYYNISVQIPGLSDIEPQP